MELETKCFSHQSILKWYSPSTWRSSNSNWFRSRSRTNLQALNSYQGQGISTAHSFLHRARSYCWVWLCWYARQTIRTTNCHQIQSCQKDWWIRALLSCYETFRNSESRDPVWTNCRSSQVNWQWRETCSRNSRQESAREDGIDEPHPIPIRQQRRWWRSLLLRKQVKVKL